MRRHIVEAFESALLMMFWVSVIAGVVVGASAGGTVVSAMARDAAVFGMFFGALIGGCIGYASGVAATGLGFVFLDIRAGIAELHKTSVEGTSRLVDSIGKGPRLEAASQPKSKLKSPKSKTPAKPAVKKRTDTPADADVPGSCPNCAEHGVVGTVCTGRECRGMFRFTRDSIRS